MKILKITEERLIEILTYLQWHRNSPLYMRTFEIGEDVFLSVYLKKENKTQ